MSPAMMSPAYVPWGSMALHLSGGHGLLLGFLVSGAVHVADGAHHHGLVVLHLVIQVINVVEVGFDLRFKLLPLRRHGGISSDPDA